MTDKEWLELSLQGLLYLIGHNKDRIFDLEKALKRLEQHDEIRESCAATMEKRLDAIVIAFEERLLKLEGK